MSNDVPDGWELVEARGDSMLVRTPNGRRRRVSKPISREEWQDSHRKNEEPEPDSQYVFNFYDELFGWVLGMAISFAVPAKEVSDE